MDKTEPWYKRNKERHSAYNKEYYKKMYAERPIHYLLKAAKARAKKAGLDFDITADDLTMPEVCPVLGIKLERHEGRLRYNSPSVDRIDNSRGYVKGNVAIISNKANTKKGELTIDEVRSLLIYMERGADRIK